MRKKSDGSIAQGKTEIPRANGTDLTRCPT
jgi:hypothetical protein